MSVNTERRHIYPVLSENVRLHRNAAGGYLTVLEPQVAEVRPGYRRPARASFATEGYVLDYLGLVNGQRDARALEEAFSTKYGLVFGPVLAGTVWDMLGGTLAELVEFLPEPVSGPRETPATGGDDAFYPAHATFEIIETCNFACDHCYYSSAPWKTGKIEFADAVRVMDRLRSNGARVIELTGGECTIHPEFLDILAAASERFDMVAVITNGYRIGTNEAFAAKVCATPNLIAQVSIDGLDERHDTFRKHRKAFESAVSAVRRLVAAGKLVRIASAISEATLDDVAGLYELGKSLGVAKHEFSPVAALGRGCNVTDAAHGSQRLVHQINERLAALQDYVPTYAEVPTLATGYELPRNCGAGWRTFAIDYNGEVRACNFSRESKKFGNILDDDYSSIFGQRANFLFHNAPSPGGRDCLGCDYYHYCRGCFVKAFMVSEKEYPECPWRAKWFPRMPLTRENHPAGQAAQDIRRSLPRYTVEDNPVVCRSCAPADDHSDGVRVGTDMSAGGGHGGSGGSATPGPVFLGSIGVRHE